MQNGPVTQTLTWKLFYYSIFVSVFGFLLGPGGVIVGLFLGYSISGLYTGQMRIGMGLFTFWKFLITLVVLGVLYVVSITSMRELVEPIYRMCVILMPFTGVLLIIKQF